MGCLVGENRFEAYESILLHLRDLFELGYQRRERELAGLARAGGEWAELFERVVHAVVHKRKHRLAGGIAFVERGDACYLGGPGFRDFGFEGGWERKTS